MERELLTLWIIFASNGKMSELTHVYARRRGSRQATGASLVEHNAPPYQNIASRAYPSGFRFGFTTLPGIAIDNDLHVE